MRSYSNGFTLIEASLTLAGVMMFATAVWYLAFAGSAQSNAEAVVAAVRNLEEQVSTQYSTAYDFSGLTDPGAVAALQPTQALQNNGTQASQWGTWSILPIPRTDPDGTVVLAGGFQVTLSDLPTKACVVIAGGLRAAASQVLVDDIPVENPEGLSAACGTDEGHAVAVVVYDSAKMGPIPPHA